MKYIMFWRPRGADVYDVELAENEEELVTIIQQKQINLQTMEKIEIETKIYPYLAEGYLVLNKRTLQTRIVRRPEFIEGKVKLYNFDEPYKAENQKSGRIPLIPEEWDINDCIPIDSFELEKYDFRFGTPMGERERHPSCELREFLDW